MPDSATSIQPCETITIGEIAERLGVSTSAIRVWITQGRFLPPLAFSRKKIWLLSTFEAWLATQQQQEVAHATDAK